jgi:ATP-dependent DNA ligase
MLDLRLRFVNSGRRQPSEMVRARCQKATADSTLCGIVPTNARMSLRERTRPGLGIIEPCLPSPAKVPPSGPGWLHEIKHDGFGILARRDSAGVRAESVWPRPSGLGGVDGVRGHGRGRL